MVRSPIFFKKQFSTNLNANWTYGQNIESGDTHPLITLDIPLKTIRDYPPKAVTEDGHPSANSWVGSNHNHWLARFSMKYMLRPLKSRQIDSKNVISLWQERNKYVMCMCIKGGALWKKEKRKNLIKIN